VDKAVDKTVDNFGYKVLAVPRRAWKSGLTSDGEVASQYHSEGAGPGPWMFHVEPQLAVFDDPHQQVAGSSATFKPE
jgi:hypothetical protein